MSYAELHTLSHFSFLRSTAAPEQLVAAACELGYQALALTDECSMAGIVRAHIAAEEHGIKLIIGTEIHLTDGPSLVLLAPDQQAYSQLCALITRGRGRAPKGQYELYWQDIAELVPNSLCLWPVLASPPQQWASIHRQLTALTHRWWGLVERDLSAINTARYQQLMAQQSQQPWPLVAGNTILMTDPKQQPLLDTMTAIRCNQPLANLGTALQSNGEHCLRPLSKLAALYPPALLQATVTIAEQCQFSLASLHYEYPAELVPAHTNATHYLRELVSIGSQRRFPEGMPPAIKHTLEHELALIAELGYEMFFLTIHDIVQFAKQHDILYQGRGSAANSVVCYCLEITAVDPRKVAVLFERFISRERGEPPDIDVDFEHHRREEVIQYIYRKYGRQRAALVASVISYRLRSAVRDVGKALGFPEGQLSQLLAQVDQRDHEQPWYQQLPAAGIALNSLKGQQLITLVEQLRGKPRHLSQHVGGFVIAHAPLHQLVPIENASMPGRTVIQWDKDDIEALGLLKVDILALGMLTAIQRCFKTLEQWHQRPFSMADVQWEDPAVYELISRADTVGVFQIESRAQMAMLPRLRPQCYYDLVIQIAIVRPGPIQGGMVHPYLQQRQSSHPPRYPSAAVEAVLSRTLGVPIFQEQVIKLVMVAAGFSAGEADHLRRVMGSWHRHGQVTQFKERLISGMRKNGYSSEYAQRIYQQICGFGEYGFPESHSASFALLAYVSAWLKCYYPAAFYCALLNSQPMGFYSPWQLLQDAQRHQVTLLPVDVNASQQAHQLQPGPAGEPALRLGLQQIQRLSTAHIKQLLANRRSAGYQSLNELRQRSGLPASALEQLASAGALQSLTDNRYQARWQLRDPLIPTALSLPAAPEANVQLPCPDELATTYEDYAALRLSLGRHPLAWLREQGYLSRITSAEQLASLRAGQPCRICGLVTARQRPSTASGVTFISLEDETGTINVVVWQATQRAQRQPFLQARLLTVQGIVEQQDGVIHVIAGRLTDCSQWLAELSVRARHFH